MCDQQRLRPACAYAQTDQSLSWSLRYSVSVKLLTEPHLRFLSLKGGCTGSSESTLVTAQMIFLVYLVTYKGEYGMSVKALFTRIQTCLFSTGDNGMSEVRLFEHVFRCHINQDSFSSVD